MSSPVTLPSSVRRVAAAELVADLRRAVGRMTWRVVSVTLGIAAALDVWSVVEATLRSEPKLPASEAYASATVINLAMSFAIMFATLIADERVARGARRALTYASAVVIGSAAGALAQSLLHQWLRLRWHSDIPSVPHGVTVMQPAVVFFEYLIWGSIIVFIYANRRHALLATAHMNAARVQRSDAQRRTLESRLLALQARVEPQFLLDTLAQVHELYDIDTQEASRLLGNLIVYLRAALPHLRDSASTLGRELDLASAYVDIVRLRGDQRLAVAFEAADDLRTARMPPMVLLPLISRAMVDVFAKGCRSGSVCIAARGTADRLRVEVACSGQGHVLDVGGFDLADIRERLNSLYGSAATLRAVASSRHAFELAVEIPLESAHGSHC